ncbi:Formate hydrogenlyase subunit 7 [Arcticibacter svalbardensis MN12-7]|uniref:Formate hydrogenlyase subunit 7 n=1 Tax=Arcticibacter svalbardensis MN12-7 TaxID=1150600 RepID=R9GPU8_9SPHI|nr:4Fe-4S binding protein [Arcticibacter svalbardensis]EOR93718.1 Formate hydrogenlyase subunit 7 [Arcticibacter svalbardensis MN12-7]
MIDHLKILFHQGKQYIPDVTKVVISDTFRGRPLISKLQVDEQHLINLCPTGAISNMPFSIDLGKCVFCGQCAIACPEKIKFSNDYKMATNDRNALIIKESEDQPILLHAELIRKEISTYFKGSLKLRQVCAGGDNSCELELNAASNVNFDMSRFGIEFVASPRHADGIVITGPVTENMAASLKLCYEAIPDPKIIILAGTDAISGGMFNHSDAVNRSFLDLYPIDLYIPGNPIHPLSFINGLLELIRKR